MVGLRVGEKQISNDLFSLENMVVATFVVPILFNYLTEIFMAYGLPSLISLSYIIIFILYAFIIGKAFLLNSLGIFLVLFIGTFAIFFSCVITPEITEYVFTANTEGYYGFLTSNFMSYFTRCLVMVIAFVARIDVKKLTECLTRCSVFIVLSYIILNFVNFSHLGHSPQYMTNAYSALIPVALLYNKGISEKKVLNVLLSLLAGFFLLVSGSRGAAITFIAFIFLYHIIAGEFTSKKLMIIVFACALMIAFVYNLDSIFSWLAQFFEKFGISTRLIDLINGSESGIYRSDGRVLIYETALERIEIIGGGLFFDRCITSYAYAHNFILEVLLDFGLILGIPILLIIGYKIFRFAKKAHNIETIMVWVPIVLASFLVHYMFSASFLIAQDFWIMIGIIFTVASSKFLAVEPMEYKV